MVSRIYEFCTEQQQQKPKRKNGFFIWDAANGNIVLHGQISANGATVNLFLTSKASRTFVVRSR